MIRFLRSPERLMRVSRCVRGHARRHICIPAQVDITCAQKSNQGDKGATVRCVRVCVLRDLPGEVCHRSEDQGGTSPALTGLSGSARSRRRLDGLMICDVCVGFFFWELG